MPDDAFKKTPDDAFVGTTDDKWIIDCTVSPSALTEAWTLNAITQAVAQLPAKQDLRWELISVPINSEKLIDGSFEVVTFDDPYYYADNWDHVISGSGNSQLDYVIVKRGIYSAKLSRGAGVGSGYVSQNISVTPGERFVISFWHYGTGTFGGQLAILDVTHSSYLSGYGLTDVTLDADATWKKYSYQFVVPSGCSTIRIDLLFDDGNGAVYFDSASLIYGTLAPTVVNLPAKLDLAWTLKDPLWVKSLLFLASKQDLTWSVNAPTIVTAVGKTVYPDVQNLTWSLKTIGISAGDYFADTTADKWVSGADRWSFKSGAGIDTQIQVDKQELTWSLKAPVAAFGKIVYPYDHLTDEDGNAIFDEAGNPIPLEGAMDEVTLTWSIKAPSIYKDPEIKYTPSKFTLTWSLSSPVVGPVVVPDVQQLTYTLSDGTPVVAVFPAKSDLTWTVNAPSIFGDTMPKPSVLNLTWTLNAPRVGGTGRTRRRKKGLLLGVYQG